MGRSRLRDFLYLYEQLCYVWTLAVFPTFYLLFGFKMNVKESMKVINPEDLLDGERYSKSKPVIYLFGWAGASEEKMGK